MGLVTPGIGLLFWMTLSFAILLWVLGKFAWKPIMKTIKERETSIEEAIDIAEKTKEEMKILKAGNEQLLKEAKEERSKLLKDARQIRDSIIEEAKVKANEEGNNIIEAAKESINYEKMAAITELKNQLATLSIKISEKILKEELSKDEKQMKLINKLLDEVNFN